MGRSGMGTQAPLFPEFTGSHSLYHGEQRWWQKQRNPQRRHAQDPLRMPQSLCLEPEAESLFVSWYKASCCSPGDMSGPQLWCWLLRIAPLGGNRELLTIIQTPCKKGSCSQPHERFGFVLLVFFNFYHCHSCYIQVFWLLFLVPDIGTIYLFAERKIRLSQSWLGVCVCAEHRLPHCYLGKEKADVNRYPLRIHLAVL